jgi:hypothetical protein
VSATVGFRRAALHLGGLWALAFAQPLFDLLGRNAQFFVARGSTTGDILALAFGYVLVPPLLGAAVVWALGRIRPALGGAALLVLVALLVAALLLPPAGDLLAGSWAAIPLALLLGAGTAALYARAAAMRTFATVLSPAPLIVLFLFLVVSPVRGLLFPDEPGAAAAAARSSTPIVQIVLDELPLTTLTGADGRIDAELFPNLARFARESTWYRNATTVDDLTTEAVPAQLTGEQPRAGSLPTARDHPHSLFTLFERSHGLTVIEPITDLCPERACAKVRAGMLDRLQALRSDLEIVVEHLLAPDDLRDGLPAIDNVWEGFENGSATGASELRGGKYLKRGVLARLARDDATAGFQRASAALDKPGSRPPLVFVHSTLPHATWRFLPDGRRYPVEGKEFPGLDSKGWFGPQWQVDQAFQRHLLQVQYTDRLVGALLDKLRARDLFDKAVIVVTADHGVALMSGEPRRPVNRANVGVIAPVPFFVKLPGQRKGRVDDGAVRTIDVLPTIAKAAGVELPWKADGKPADERAVDPRAPIDVSHAGVPVLTEPLATVLAKRRERDRVEARLLRAGVYAVGPRPELIGRRVATRTGEQRITTDPESSVWPSFVSGTADRLKPGTEIAVAVDGRVEATTRVYSDDDRPVYAALVPPSSLRDGANSVVALEVLADGELRPLG